MSKHLYFLGIGGTLMGSLAQLAKQMGFGVSGSDGAIYAPMSDQLQQAGITTFEGFDPSQLEPAPDEIIIGNAGLPRGNEAVEYILERNLNYTSGAEWLGREVMRDRWVLAVAGTHGKTTTASMLTWILDQAGLNPGYLIGGAPNNFPHSARLGDGPFFVVEADEYDTSYFDRRSKFVHYRPRTLIINNLEYDHADIFDDVSAIQAQFHLLLRTIPSGGLVLAPSESDYVSEVLHMGCWSPVARIGDKPPRKPVDQDNGEHWSIKQTGNSSAFEVLLNNKSLGSISWSLKGAHNRSNALNAIAASRHAGVPVDIAIAALNDFSGVKRRMEVIYEDAHTTIYDDFAHHPTAIRTTLQGLRDHASADEIIAIIEPRTHTMSLGALQGELVTCCAAADQVIWFRGNNIKWDLHQLASNSVIDARVEDDIKTLIKNLLALPTPSGERRRHLVIMSNGAFGGIYKEITAQFRAQAKT
ncbi:MAG: UDP-N-acetylmuramate:L-alanyl-gamma-D-glutamyl-meso-diaminopimelate ligase [Gammaproteobacteria bacterium TMED92]|nr:MAG: UDP-N-acetylmuramate:L-alanyl-gamma-D-glutamyl-meso-diaminopimelate ligase [Gammaproteobacteria bacterium TMED92]